MSRIGKRILTIPEKVNVELVNDILTVKGPKGELTLNIDKNIKLKEDWEHVMSYNPKMIYYAHANEKIL